MDNRTTNCNAWELDAIEPEWALESRVTKAAVTCFGHMIKEEHGWEDRGNEWEEKARETKNKILMSKSIKGTDVTRWLGDSCSIRKLPWFQQ